MLNIIVEKRPLKKEKIFESREWEETTIEKLTFK
jgi:hypothetical protein